MKGFYQKVTFYSALAFIAVGAVVASPKAAQAGSCSITCEKSSCSVRALLRRVYCICRPDGYAQCGTGSAPLRSEPIATASGVKIKASDAQLARIEAEIDVAYELSLVELGEAVEALYDAAVAGDAAAYFKALALYERAIDALSDEEWALLQQGGV